MLSVKISADVVRTDESREVIDGYQTEFHADLTGRDSGRFFRELQVLVNTYGGTASTEPNHRRSNLCVV